jgi:hypothetical protein
MPTYRLIQENHRGPHNKLDPNTSSLALSSRYSFEETATHNRISALTETELV